MKYFTIIFTCFFLLMSCSQDTVDLTKFTSPFGGTYAIRLPDQVQITENSFFYEVRIENNENDFVEVKRFRLERMNFYPFAPVFKKLELQYLYFSYFNFPQKQRESAYKYLADWDVKVNNNPTLFTLSETIIFAICRTQAIADHKIVTTLYQRRNEEDAFDRIYDDLERFENLTMPIIAYQAEC
ncbi:MAG: hypothetical protein HRU29_06685 [Rhizobiales bacterium]|nr:hypothetical protein [Hyphomicrobiales bacterium]NRB14071.1 hypothetical protein [Hyphomicrobiales bacterium]